MNNLFKEAIADAKAVKDIAQKNAISTLTEAFAPQMQSLLSRRLAEKDEEEMDEDPSLEAPVDALDTEDPAAVDAPPAPEAPMEDEEDTDIDEVLAELEGEDEFEDEEPVMEAEDEFEMEDEPAEEDSIDEILDEVENELNLEAADEELDDEEDVAPQMENIKLKRKLKEAIKCINAQKGVINEVGILNAKLLFTTKLLGKYDLTENQKMKILEAFDRVKNLREAKLVYATISEGMRRKVTTKSKTTKRVTEGTSSKAIKAITKPINENVNSSETFVDKARWQKLAGIIN